jgi:hypothetical protein
MPSSAARNADLNQLALNEVTLVWWVLTTR